MYSYFHIYKPNGVNSNAKCNCGHCDTYPELFHAQLYSITPYKRITTIEQARAQLNKFPDGIIVEFFTSEYDGFKTHLYKNHNSGKTWKYNPENHKWS